MFGVCFTDERVTNFEKAKTSNLEMFRSYYQKMAARGVFFPPSQFKGLFRSISHTDEDIEQTIEAVELTFKERQVEFDR
jgi:glutamate-1-semialdehyde 2,1-aminomutase